ncbi:MAG: hypothetical protein K5755_05305 [Clostridiales bacterium]|nr:hypothetical protein [Clostridia bacterium]MCR4564032.1 hypothetical protein [Clostridiales bacterium]
MAKMTRDELLREIVEVVYECAPELEGVELKEETVINTDTGIDSMGLTLIICRLEANLGVNIPQRQWKKLFTLGDVVDAFYSRL